MKKALSNEKSLLSRVPDHTEFDLSTILEEKAEAEMWESLPPAGRKDHHRNKRSLTKVRSISFTISIGRNASSDEGPPRKKVARRLIKEELQPSASLMNLPGRVCQNVLLFLDPANLLYLIFRHRIQEVQSGNHRQHIAHV